MAGNWIRKFRCLEKLSYLPGVTNSVCQVGTRTFSTLTFVFIEMRNHFKKWLLLKFVNVKQTQGC